MIVSIFTGLCIALLALGGLAVVALIILIPICLIAYFYDSYTGGKH